MTELTRTRAAIERGIDEGLHIGGQLYASIAGEPVPRVTLSVVRHEAITVAPATGRGAAALSSGFRGRRRR